jgi:hypothetical protein
MVDVRFTVQPRNFSPLLSVQTGIGVHPASYLTSVGVSPPGVKYPGSTLLHLVQRSNMVEQYLHSPKGFHGIFVSLNINRAATLCGFRILFLNIPANSFCSYFYCFIGIRYFNLFSNIVTLASLASVL